MDDIGTVMTDPFEQGDDSDAADLSYEEARDILTSGDAAALTTLARRADVRPEILYYLAQNGPSGARLAVAKNRATPFKADKLLSADGVDDVRAELARKIARIVPDATEHENAKLREAALELLETLARDEVPVVRHIIAEEIKAMPGLPIGLARQLAADPSDAVSCPMLEYSPLLGEDDLRELIAAGLTQQALSATARRVGLGEEVSDDIAASLDVPAVAALLTNESAQIRDDTMDKIITQAQEVQDLHQPLAMRPDLSVRAMNRIASFVASSLVEAMADRNGLPAGAKDQLLQRVRQRVSREKKERMAQQEALKTARTMLLNGQIDDRGITELVETRKRDLVIACLSLKSRIPIENVQKILDSKSARAVTALSWRCGLRMRTAFLLQSKVALIPSAKLLPAKQGQYYPLPRAELEKQISLFL